MRMGEVEATTSGVTQCVKCEQPSTIAGCEGKNVAYCDECYKEMITHKFRSALGKRRIFKDGAAKEALVVVDGSPSSVFLLGQIHSALSLDPHKRLVMQPTVVTVVSVLSLEVLQRVRHPDRPAVHVAAVLRPEGASLLSVDEDEGKEIHLLSSLLQSCRSATARAELMRILKERLAIRLAREMNLATILLADTADDLARVSISALCLGRGAQVADMTSGAEKRKGLPLIVRPLKEVRSKEVALGNRLFGWEGDVVYVEEELVNEKSSVQSATGEFVEILQAEGFAATGKIVKTAVIRTASGRVRRVSMHEGGSVAKFEEELKRARTGQDKDRSLTFKKM